MTRQLAALFVLSVMLVGAAAASEQSELLYSHGLVEFHAAHYPEALQLFEKAVAADPSDIYAHYYRGVTQGRLKNFEAAVSDLRAVLAAKPDLDQGALEFGIALVQTGANQEAIRWLQQAQRVTALDADASFFLALAQLRLGQLDAARENLQRAAARNPQLAVTARYYLGVVEYQAHNSAAAQEYFTAVATTSPDSAVGHEATAFLAKLQQGVQGAARPYLVYGAVGLQYDSNVVLAPSDEVVKDQAGISRQADGRVVITLGGIVAPVRTEHVTLSLGYEFFQSLHFDLTDFNLQDHRPSVQVVFDWKPVRVGLQARYDFYLLQDNSFLQAGTVLPWVEIQQGEFGRTELSFRLRRRDFLAQPFSGVRDSFNYQPGIRQFVYLGARDRYATLGYRFDREDPINSQGDQFAYDGHEVSGGVGWLLPAAIAAEANYAYRYEKYALASNGRRDDEHQIIVSATKPLNEHLDVSLAYFRVMNNSTDAPFEYDRNIVSLSLGVRF